jgi:peptide/nickel transport system substrate-binding protein
MINQPSRLPAWSYALGGLITIGALLCAVFVLVSTATDKTKEAVKKEPAAETAATSPSSRSLPQNPRTLVICQGQEPVTLYKYGDSMLAAAHVQEAIYDGPFDTNSFSYQPVILEKLPSLSDGDAVIRIIKVADGDLVVNDAGDPVILEKGVKLRPAGCYSSECAIAFSGSPIEMEQMVVTFELMSGLTWSDGEPLTVYDSIYAYELLKDPHTPMSKYTIERTTSYKALDDYTSVWTGLPGYRDSTYFINFWSPLPEHIWGEFSAGELLEVEESTRSPLGWGAYVIDKWVEGHYISLYKNANYWRAGEGLPKFDKVIYRFEGEHSNANIASLLSGECDIVDQTAHLDDQSNLLLELQTSGQLNVTFVTGTVWEHADFGVVPYKDYERPDFFGDVRTRRAIAHCFDRQAVVDTVMYGQSIVLDTYLPPHHPLFNPDVPHYEFDVAKGAALLEEVGWIDHDDDLSTPRVARGVQGVPDDTPLSFNYWTTSATQRQKATQVLQASAAQCGIEIKLEYWNASEFFADGPDGPLFGRHFDMGQFAWLTGVEPACDLYDGNMISGPPEDGACGWGCANNTGWSNAAYDAVCGAAVQSLPGTPQYAQYHLQAQQIFAEQLPVIPLYLRLKLAATRPDMKNFIMDPTANSEMWNIEEFDY